MTRLLPRHTRNQQSLRKLLNPNIQADEKRAYNVIEVRSRPITAMCVDIGSQKAIGFNQSAEPGPPNAPPSAAASAGCRRPAVSAAGRLPPLRGTRPQIGVCPAASSAAAPYLAAAPPRPWLGHICGWSSALRLPASQVSCWGSTRS